MIAPELTNHQQQYLMLKRLWRIQQQKMFCLHFSIPQFGWFGKISHHHTYPIAGETFFFHINNLFVYRLEIVFELAGNNNKT